MNTRVLLVGFLSVLFMAACGTSASQPPPDMDSGRPAAPAPDASSSATAPTPTTTTPPTSTGTATNDGGPPGPTCGRLTSTSCKSGFPCAGPEDCQSLICKGNICQAAAPGDGIKNGDETDVDCGGTKAPACAVGKGCLVGTDCLSEVCKTTCQTPTATDGVQNGDETGIDCGGANAPKCATGQGCRTDGDCNNVKCDVTGTKTCRAPLPNDGLQNGNETDVDCGGGVAPACPTGKKCVATRDCAKALCDTATKTCDPASPTDGIQNGTETDVDCGGGAAPVCPTGKKCVATTDCDHVLCDTAGTKLCEPPHPNDGIQNGTETDIDCGGGAAPACATGQKCGATSDCNNVLCDVGKTNRCLGPLPNDGLQNGDETDVDCGGTAAPKCAVGKKCVATSDCNNVLCDTANMHTCSPPTSTDGLQNGNETDVDCGASGAGVDTKAPLCDTGQKCVKTADCNNVACDAGKTNRCLPPTSHDSIKNGKESDVDCGSSGAGAVDTQAPPCTTGKTCAAHADCVSDGCAYTGKCADAPSCAVHYGGDTCGYGEVGMATAKHESCCATVQIPGTKVKANKYEVTAGRMREFLNRVGGDAQTWIVNNRAKLSAGARAELPDGTGGTPNVVQYLPMDDYNPIAHNFTYYDNTQNKTVTGDHFMGVYAHLGGDVIFPDLPSSFQGCYIGVPSNTGALGEPTYWFADADQDNMGAGHRLFAQQDLDQKSLECVTQVLMAAFCAWDGGRLPVQAEYKRATNSMWGTGSYPWGSGNPYDTYPDSNAKGRIAYSSTYGGGTTYYVPMQLDDGTVQYDLAIQNNWTNWNPFHANGTPSNMPNQRYLWPTVTPANIGQNDVAAIVASPGRIVHDFHFVGPNATDGFYDVAANVMEFTGDYTGTDTGHDNLPKIAWNGGSFEGHGIGDVTFNPGFNVLTRYGKAGGRCVYDP